MELFYKLFNSDSNGPNLGDIQEISINHDPIELEADPI